MSLPSGYTQLEYIQSSGTQYINTNFIPKSTTRVIMTVEPTSISSWSCFFGERNKNAQTASESYLAAAASTTQYRSDYFGSAKTVEVSSTVKLVTIDKNANICTFNSDKITNRTSTAAARKNMFLLGLHDYNNNVKFLMSAKLYSCKIYDDGMLVRDFIPCKNPSNVVGLYDIVNSVFYANAGTGRFTAGPEVKGSHKTLIDGTWYDLKAGKCLVAGTSYQIGGGRTLVDGTAYEIGFSNGFTWIIGDTPAAWHFTETIGFVSNGERFIALEVAPSGLLYAQLIYFKEGGGNIKPFNGIAGEWGYGKAYKTVTFDEEPTGTLLRWLQANAVQQ